MKTKVPLLSGRFATAMLCVIAVCVLTIVSQALEFNVNNTNKYKNGPAFMVEMTGTFKRSPGEKRLLNAWVVILDANGNERGRDQAIIDRRAKTWTGGVGDFRGAYYYAEFRVSTVAGDRYFKTVTRRW